jgi:hypothetical protein
VLAVPRRAEYELSSSVPEAPPPLRGLLSGCDLHPLASWAEEARLLREGEPEL